MLVFITNPRNFEKRVLHKKRPELVYIFNFLPLYKELSKKFKCVNLDKDYKVKHENFFPSPHNEKIFKNKMLSLKQGTYSYFKKKEFSFMSKIQVMRGGYKDTDYKLVMHFCDLYARQERNIEKAILFMETAIENVLISILRFEKGEKFVNNNLTLIKKIFNLMNSFYRSYIYSFCELRGSEVFGDIFRLNNFLNAVMFYTFDEYDISKNDFKTLYKKVLARLFIENVHRGVVKKFVKRNIEYYKENEWL